MNTSESGGGEPIHIAIKAVKTIGNITKPFLDTLCGAPPRERFVDRKAARAMSAEERRRDLCVSCNRRLS